MKVFIFTSTKVFHRCSQTETHSKRVCRTFRLSTKIPNSAGCYREEEGFHAIYKVKEESSQSDDYGIILLMMIDNNVHPSCQLVHQPFSVSKSPTLAMASLRESIVPWYMSQVLSAKVRRNLSKISSHGILYILVICSGELLALEIHGNFNLRLPTR